MRDDEQLLWLEKLAGELPKAEFSGLPDDELLIVATRAAELRTTVVPLIARIAVELSRRDPETYSLRHLARRIGVDDASLTRWTAPFR